MFPFIRDGDVITVSPLKSPPRLGDVVAFRPSQRQQLFIHRVIGGKRGSYLIKGDNTAANDGFQSRASILGRVILVERNGRRVYCGMGPERLLIALLVRTNLLSPLLQLIGGFLHLSKRLLSFVENFFGIRT